MVKCQGVTVPLGNSFGIFNPWAMMSMKRPSRGSTLAPEGSWSAKCPWALTQLTAKWPESTVAQVNLKGVVWTCLLPLLLWRTTGMLSLPGIILTFYFQICSIAHVLLFCVLVYIYIYVCVCVLHNIDRLHNYNKWLDSNLIWVGPLVQLFYHEVKICNNKHLRFLEIFEILIFDNLW